MSVLFTWLALGSLPLVARIAPVTLSDWQMQNAALVSDRASAISSPNYQPAQWYKASVPGTVLTTLVQNKMYPEPRYGEDLRAIQETLNKTSYWYRTRCTAPAESEGRRA
jgi:beta-mannosidase